MASMEDLIANISGGMHVSQDGYDLRALQEYLAQTMGGSSTVPFSPVGGPGNNGGLYRRLGPSRSTSSTRRPTSLPNGTGNLLHSEMGTLPYPSPLTNFSIDVDGSQMQYEGYEAGTNHAQANRPGALRRSSSYGFGGATSPSCAASPYIEYSAFEKDAFAPLVQQPTPPSSDPWAAMRQASAPAPAHHDPWAAFASPTAGPSNTGLGSNMVLQPDAFRKKPQQAAGLGRPPTPPDEDDEMMDEDVVEQQMAEPFEQSIVQPEADQYRTLQQGPDPRQTVNDFGTSRGRYDLRRRKG